MLRRGSLCLPSSLFRACICAASLNDGYHSVDLLSSNDGILEVESPAPIDVLFPSNLALCQMLI